MKTYLGKYYLAHPLANFPVDYVLIQDTDAAAAKVKLDAYAKKIAADLSKQFKGVVVKDSFVMETL